MMQIYNSLTQRKEPFKPLDGNNVLIYVCGMTVYDHCHIGHARAQVAFDVIVRSLRSRGYDVTYVRNITDIDDKILARALENKEPYTTLTERMISSMRDDFAALSILPPDKEPLATDHIASIISMVSELVEKDHAYVASDGDVYYRVRSFPRYGELAHKDLEGLRAGERVAVADSKHEPLDFVLWKMAKADEPSWDSPWGAGRPGWHIECSAMSKNCLGEYFDIHGGGADLLFPHHQNEVAQSEAANGCTLANTWMHVGFLQVDKEKMSKSLDNFFTIKEVLAKTPAEVLRYFLVSSHYRSQINYTEKSLDSAKASLERLYLALRDLATVDAAENTDFQEKFSKAMDDDFNVPEALAVLFELAREINRLKQLGDSKASAYGALLKSLAGVLGFLQQDPEAFFKGNKAAGLADAEVDALISARAQARLDKDWAESDRLRDVLCEDGVILEDGATGTTWRRH